MKRLTVVTAGLALFAFGASLGSALASRHFARSRPALFGSAAAQGVPGQTLVDGRMLRLGFMHDRQVEANVVGTANGATCYVLFLPNGDNVQMAMSCVK